MIKGKYFVTLDITMIEFGKIKVSVRQYNSKVHQ